MSPGFHYAIGSYKSYQVSGTLNRSALLQAGETLCDRVQDAKIFLFHGEVRDLPTYLIKHPELAEKYVVAYTVWETDKVPDSLRHNFALADEIWTASDYCRSILRQYHDCVHVVPHIVAPADPSDQEVARLRSMCGIEPGDFVYYAIVSSVHKRKNITGLYAAMSELLRKTDAKIILKTDIVLPLEGSQQTDRVFNLVGRVPNETIQAVHHIGHCLMSPHHSEGWGLGLSDAMAHGNLVVATGFGGNMHFMNEGNSMPVQFRRVEAETDFVWGSGGRWAQVDLHDFVGKCLKAKQDWEALAPMRHAAISVRHDFGFTTAANVMKQRLSAIRSELDHAELLKNASS